MTRHIDPKPAAVLAAVLALEFPGEFSPHIAARDAESLIRLGKRAARIAEQRCNGIARFDPRTRQVFAQWTEQDEERAERATARVEAQTKDILGKYGATNIKAHGDPRGFVLTFRLASGRGNSIDSGVWGV